jgi:hypothetical protein
MCFLTLSDGFHETKGSVVPILVNAKTPFGNPALFKVGKLSLKLSFVHPFEHDSFKIMGQLPFVESLTRKAQTYGRRLEIQPELYIE